MTREASVKMQKTGYAGLLLVSEFGFACFGGDEEDRTLDLRVANAALSRLSYVPKGPLHDTTKFEQLQGKILSVCIFIKFHHPCVYKGNSEYVKMAR